MVITCVKKIYRSVNDLMCPRMRDIVAYHIHDDRLLAFSLQLLVERKVRVMRI
jgi:hypothetical protein